MRATDFLNETQVKKYTSRSINLETAMTLLNSKCSDSASLLRKPIWRGMTNHDQQIIFADPSTGERKSQNTSNYYTLLIDSSPHMEGWPKRSASFICSSGRQYASGYSKGSGLYAIFPFDGVKIAVCPKKDMWETDISIPEFDVLIAGTGYNMDLFNDWIEQLGITATVEGLQKAQTKPKVVKLCQKNKIDPKNFIPIVQAALSPSRAGFKLVTIKEFVAGNFNNQEVWIGGPVVAIREDLYKKFLDAYVGTPAAIDLVKKAGGHVGGMMP